MPRSTYRWRESEWLVVSAVDGLITIPMAGRTESLNVGMAAAILSFEAARQRRA